MKRVLVMMILATCGLATAAELHVPSPHTTIQAAINAASNGDKVIVAPGTYAGVNTLGKAITIKASGTPAQTIIDGQGASRGITCDSGEDDDTIIEGFTITGGSADHGGAIWCSQSSPTIMGCTISGNTATSYNGGAIWCSWSNPTISRCTISGNLATHGNGGGIYCSNSNATITDCEIDNNTATYGGGISCFYSDLMITNCMISNNTATSQSGGAIWCSWSDPLLIGCRILANSAALYGGGIHCINSSPTITGCAIANNATDNHDHGGGIYCELTSNPDTSNPTIGGSTVCGNSPDQIHGDWHDSGSNTVQVGCPSCPSDVDGDIFVGWNDVLAVIGAWGSNDPDADVDNDNIVGIFDLLTVLTAWGQCE